MGFVVGHQGDPNFGLQPRSANRTACFSFQDAAPQRAALSQLATIHQPFQWHSQHQNGGSAESAIYKRGSENIPPQADCKKAKVSRKPFLPTQTMSFTDALRMHCASQIPKKPDPPAKPARPLFNVSGYKCIAATDDELFEGVKLQKGDLVAHYHEDREAWFVGTVSALNWRKKDWAKYPPDGNNPAQIKTPFDARQEYTIDTARDRYGSVWWKVQDSEHSCFSAE
jgi:hypothetical protein